ncbi:hypothetical protein PIB30_014956 [Stylosanthes scabra]|uniref:Uncharacterized protein n=1 Tax=Stylosanthes scabra TaxID=79078 RepID=A0ABU6W5I4_9FABA|nr:hypothetical protein [Stylosanthes scabra]
MLETKIIFYPLRNKQGAVTSKQNTCPHALHTTYFSTHVDKLTINTRVVPIVITSCGDYPMNFTLFSYRRQNPFHLKQSGTPSSGVDAAAAIILIVAAASDWSSSAVRRQSTACCRRRLEKVHQRRCRCRDAPSSFDNSGAVYALSSVMS